MSCSRHLSNSKITARKWWIIPFKAILSHHYKICISIWIEFYCLKPVPNETIQFRNLYPLVFTQSTLNFSCSLEMQETDRTRAIQVFSFSKAWFLHLEPPNLFAENYLLGSPLPFVIAPHALALPPFARHQRVKRCKSCLRHAFVWPCSTIST